MDDSGSNYKTPIDRPQYQPTFLRSIDRPRPFLRYLRQPIKHRARKDGISVAQSRGGKFLQPNPPFRPSSPDSQPRISQELPDNPNPLNPSNPYNKWYNRWKIANRLRYLVSWIMDIVHYVQHHTASCGCSASCVCVGVVTTVTVTAVGVGLGVGLGVGVKNDNADIDVAAASNPQTDANSQTASNSTIISLSPLIYFFAIALIVLLKARG